VPRRPRTSPLGEGADLAAFSGGKAIGAPAASGTLAGRRDLILPRRPSSRTCTSDPRPPGPWAATLRRPCPTGPQQPSVDRRSAAKIVAAVALRRYRHRPRTGGRRWRSIADRFDAIDGIGGASAGNQLTTV
jgi:L-seryl-tRNA(Ser) seleniumtransferase